MTATRRYTCRVLYAPAVVSFWLMTTVEDAGSENRSPLGMKNPHGANGLRRRAR